ncbi:molecular chaperone [Salmonella enterica subsp. enterica]|uniref:Molecular chaperone n=1 Tax=Salmonella enterica I TaxID=59201 RepID=A0A379VUF3_SALET|nr:molecular chaperone [Salmonella enterica subsp. enterica]
MANRCCIFPAPAPVPGLLWAEALHSGALSPLSESFIARRLNYGAPAMSEAHSQHPYWLLYQVADSLACAEDPSAALLQRLVTKLDAPDICPLEALIIRGLLGRLRLSTHRVKL